MKTLPLTLLAALLTLALPHALRALSPGDCMVVGYDASSPDSVSFVTWVELAPGEQITILDAEYDGSGNGSGEGTAGGTYNGNSDTMVWTNSTGSTVSPGTVIVVGDDDSANIGSASGDLPLTAGGEQFFLVQGTLNNSDNFIGDLLFGVDFENGTSWGESGESDLPGALNTTTGNLSFGHQNRMEYIGPRDGLPMSAYPALVADSANWQLATSALSATAFEESIVPPEPVPDRLGAVSTGLTFHARRLNNELPIIDESWMLSQGSTVIEADNINGSHCIRLPNWLPVADRAHPSALYYLYFADHNGNFIRMAWAANLEGPWTGYRMDANLPLQDRGVLSLGTDDEITPGNDILLDGHVASPQVFADDANQQFVMYFHSPTEHNGNDKGQSTVVATSADGLNFNLPADGGQAGHGVQPIVLGESYFRVFDDGTDFYAFSNTGDLWGAPDPANLYTAPAGYDFSKDYWDKGPNVYTDSYSLRGWDTLRPRHFGVLQRDGLVYAFNTNKEGAPERILAATYDFSQLPEDYNHWTLRFPQQEILRAETTWEGANFPPIASESGSADDGVNQLRDPSVLADSDGRTYLFYSGQGEDAIGLARLVSAPVITGETQTTRGQSHTFTIDNDIDVTTAVRRIAHATPADLALDAEAATLPFDYNGTGGYPTTQTHTVATGSNAFHLAHTASGASETLTLPQRYYARPGAFLSFSC